MRVSRVGASKAARRNGIDRGTVTAMSLRETYRAKLVEAWVE